MFEKFQNKVENVSGLIKDTAKIAVIMSLLSTFNNEVNAQDNKVEKVDLKHQIELAQEAIKKINIELNEKCKNIIQTTNGQSVNRYNFSNGQFAESAENGDYFVIFNKDGTRGFMDYNSDGKLDRVIMDDTKASLDKPIKRSINSNILDMSGSIENISKLAEVSSSVDPEKVKVIEIRADKGEVYMADLEDGEHGIFTGENASAVIEKLQVAYTSQLENIANNGNKIKEDVVETEKTRNEKIEKNISGEWQKYKVEQPEEPPISNKPEEQPVYHPTPHVEKADYQVTLEDFKKAKESEFDSLKKSQEEEFNKFKEGK